MLNEIVRRYAKISNLALMSAIGIATIHKETFEPEIIFSADNQDQEYQDSSLSFGKMVQNRLYVNEPSFFYANGNIYPNKPLTKLTKAGTLVYLALHFFDVDKDGFCKIANVNVIAEMCGLHRKTVRAMLDKLNQAGYICGAIKPEKDGDFSYNIRGYKDIYEPAQNGGRGFTNLYLQDFMKLCRLKDVNALRLLLRVITKLDNPKAPSKICVSYKSVHAVLPAHVTSEKIDTLVDKIMSVCDFVVIKTDGKQIFADMPADKDPKNRIERDAVDNQQSLKDAMDEINQDFESHEREKEAACGRPAESAAKARFILAADELKQLGKTAALYGVELVKKGLDYMAFRVNTLKENIAFPNSYFLALLGRHTDGDFYESAI